MAKDTKSTIIIATISAISAVIVAVITTYGTIAVSGTKVRDRVTDQIEIEKTRNLPIGTIIPSMLKPTDFAKEVGDDGSGPPYWVLADGQKDVTSSDYGKLSGKTTPPDLRGMFLRGMNEEREDEYRDMEGDRPVGEPQKGGFAGHKHEIAGHDGKDKSGKIKAPVFEKVLGPGNNNLATWSPYEGIPGETRPNNVAVYFYIKIN